MKAIFPKFAAAIVAVAAFSASGGVAISPTLAIGQDVAPAGQGRAAAVMSRAVATLARRESIEAKIRHSVDLLGQQFVGSGRYQQQGRGVGAKLRLELQIQSAQKSTTLTQVCDGRSFWRHKKSEKSSSFQVIDVRKVREALAAAAPTATTPPSIPPSGLSLGGLPKLMQSIESHFAFDSITAGPQVGSVPMLVLSGRWRAKQLAALLPDEKEAILAGRKADLTKLPPHLPDRVVVYLGRDDLFPYRIEYRRAPAKLDKNNPASDKAIVTMEWFEVKFAATIDRRQFVYRPGKQNPTDVTAKYLQKQGLKKPSRAGG